MEYTFWGQDDQDILVYALDRDMQDDQEMEDNDDSLIEDEDEDLLEDDDADDMEELDEEERDA